MQSNSLTTISVIAVLTALTAPVHLPAQDQAAAEGHKNHRRYRFIDLGTFGGHNSSTDGATAVINNRGVVVGAADTADPCPYFPDIPISPGFKWENGVMTKLPLLPGGCGAFPLAINDYGLIVGVADNGVLDPATRAPEIRPVAWKNGRIVDLGTFGGANGLAVALNNRGQVTGMAQNAIPDPFNFGNIINLPNGTEWRGFLWQDGVMHDLGTLGGSDAAVTGYPNINERGHVAGISFTDDIVNPVTGFPTLDSFLWRRGDKLDLGTLGGTFTNAVTMNSREEIIGSSNLAGDTIFHPFLWSRGVLTDLGTLGGDTGNALWNSDAGGVVGAADLPGSQVHHAFFWKHGVMHDLGTVDNDPCSNGNYVTSKSIVIGTSTDCHGLLLHLFMSENGGPLIDLTPVVPPDAGLRLGDLKFVNDHGVITASGVLPNGDEHAVVLIPCRPVEDEDRNGDDGCREASLDPTPTHVSAMAAINANQPKATSREMFLNRRLSHHRHITDFGMPKR